MSDQERIFKPRKHVAFRNIGGQMVLVDGLDERLVTLNETGTAIWGQLDGRSTLEIAREIHERFRVSLEDAMKDTEEFLSELERKGFIQRESG